MLYTQSNIRDILDTENFAAFSFDYYSPELTDPSTGITSLESAQNAYDKAWDFIEHFQEEPGLVNLRRNRSGKNLSHTLYCQRITGQGFLCYILLLLIYLIYCPKMLLKKTRSPQNTGSLCFDCDLLIIDDLGTELTNSFVSSQLFCCINERIMNKKSTIISTNLTLADFMETYSERAFSRVTSNYTMLKLVGNDIRIQKRLLGGK